LIHGIINFSAIGEIALIADKTAVSIGEELTIMCYVLLGNPNVYTFEWYHNGVLLLPANLSKSPNNFTVDSVVRESGGIYKCVSSNTAGSTSTTILISIRGE